MNDYLINIINNVNNTAPDISEHTISRLLSYLNRQRSTIKSIEFVNKINEVLNIIMKNDPFVKNTQVDLFLDGYYPSESEILSYTEISQQPSISPTLVNLLCSKKYNNINEGLHHIFNILLKSKIPSVASLNISNIMHDVISYIILENASDEFVQTTSDIINMLISAHNLEAKYIVDIYARTLFTYKKNIMSADSANNEITFNKLLKIFNSMLPYQSLSGNLFFNKKEENSLEHSSTLHIISTINMLYNIVFVSCDVEEIKHDDNDDNENNQLKKIPFALMVYLMKLYHASSDCLDNLLHVFDVNNIINNDNLMFELHIMYMPHVSSCAPGLTLIKIMAYFNIMVGVNTIKHYTKNHCTGLIQVIVQNNFITLTNEIMEIVMIYMIKSARYDEIELLLANKFIVNDKIVHQLIHSHAQINKCLELFKTYNAINQKLENKLMRINGCFSTKKIKITKNSYNKKIIKTPVKMDNEMVLAMLTYMADYDTLKQYKKEIILCFNDCCFNDYCFNIMVKYKDGLQFMIHELKYIPDLLQILSINDINDRIILANMFYPELLCVTKPPKIGKVNKVDVVNTVDKVDVVDTVKKIKKTKTKTVKIKK